MELRTFSQVFEELIGRAEHVQIACGYVSSLAIVELEAILRENTDILSFDLIIGMHKFDGFTRTQYESALRLDSYLKSKKMGTVRIVTSFPFHGKVYSFSKSDDMFAAIIGSSNLSGILSSHTNYEVDTLTTDTSTLIQVQDLMHRLVTIASVELTDLSESDLTINQSNNRSLDSVENVKRHSPSDLEETQANLTDLSFNIPIKTTPKSNLNVYFGKGRLNSRTNFVRPRHWYEVELIVPKEITKHPNYPKSESDFLVITDDGWSFHCKVSGDFKKNFRSSNNLQILGRWLKGRLEETGCLKVGEPVTNDVLACYGRDSFILHQTNDPNTWYLDFSQGG